VLKTTIGSLLVTIALAGIAAAEHPRPLRGTYIPIGPRRAEEPTPRLGPRHRILFVNRYGGTYSPGNVDDSSENRSTVAGETSRIPAFHGGDAGWAQVMSCLKDIYGPYAIEVTDVEPTPGTTYIESVVGGSWQDLKGIGPAGGVSPFRCETIERGINYTFSADYGEDWRTICEVVAQESAHSFGLEHEMLCDDPLTYLPACGPRRFQDFDAHCGEFENRVCSCGGSLQNSHQHLLAVLGPSDDIPPDVALTSPRDGETVSAGFAITAEAMDDVRVDRVEYFIDGAMVGSDERPLYQGEAPIDLLPGEHVVEAVAVDGDENRKGQAVRVTVPAACAVDGDCQAGTVCAQSRCLGAIGAGCEDHTDCANEQCYFDTLAVEGYCTVLCDSDAACPDGFACLEPEFGSRRCMPRSNSDGGCTVSAAAPAELSARRARRAASLAALALAFCSLLRRSGRRRVAQAG
jgi:hypothetical protein